MSKNSELLNQAIHEVLEEPRTYLNEGRSAPQQMTTSDFQLDIKNYVQNQFEDETTGDKKGSNLIGMSGVDESLFQEIVRSVEDYINREYKNATLNEPPALVDPRDAPVTDSGERWDQYEDYAAVSEMGSNSHYTMWVVINESVYYWKFSTSKNAGTSLRAADYEVAICTGYNIYKDRDNEDNPFLDEDGRIDPSADVSPEEIQPYVENAVEGSASDAEINKSLAAINTGLGVILRNRRLQDKGSEAVQYGAASVQTSPKYTGTDNTPKTDFFFDDGTNVSLKKKGTNPQIMSGQVEDSKGVFNAAMYYFDENEEGEKRKLKEELVSSFEDDFDKINRPTKQQTVTSVRNEAINAYTDNRAEEIHEKISDLISRSRDGKISLNTVDGESYNINSSNDYKEIAIAHAEAEMSFHKVANQGGSSHRKRLIKRFVIDREDLVRRIDNQFDQGDVEKIDELSKQILKRTLDHRKATNIAKKLVEDSEEFGKWAVFEAATGLYKFDGPTPSPFSNLQDASTPVSDTYLKFDPLPGDKGDDILHDIDEKWVSERASNVNIRVSFKTRSSGFYSTLRLEGAGDTKKLDQKIEQERKSMIEDIKNQIEIRNKIRSEKINEDVFGYDVKQAVQNALQKGRSILGYISKRFKEFVKNTSNYIKKTVSEVLDRGLSSLFDFLGMTVEEVEISPITI